MIRGIIARKRNLKSYQVYLFSYVIIVQILRITTKNGKMLSIFAQEAFRSIFENIVSLFVNGKKTSFDKYDFLWMTWIMSMEYCSLFVIKIVSSFPILFQPTRQIVEVIVTCRTNRYAYFYFIKCSRIYDKIAQIGTLSTFVTSKTWSTTIQTVKSQSTNSSQSMNLEKQMRMYSHFKFKIVTFIPWQLI